MEIQLLSGSRVLGSDILGIQDGEFLSFNYTFIPAGSSVTREGDRLHVKDDSNVSGLSFPYGRTFVLDVGNRLGDGIIDHHQPGTEAECVASMVARDPDRWIGQYLYKSNQYWLITHFSPDFDAVGSVFLVEKYIRAGSFPEFVTELGDYALKVDSGKMKLDKNRIVQPFSLMLAISKTVHGNPLIPFEDRNFEILNSGFKLFDGMWSILSNGRNVEQVDWEARSEFHEQTSLLKQDAKIYEDDIFNRSEMYQLNLSSFKSLEVSRIDCLVTRLPKSILWKYWARGDTDHSAHETGYTMTIAFLPSKKTRAIISVDPTASYSLKGLGLYLDYFEMKKLLTNKTLADLTKNKREGFHRENPWYDGRSAMHNFTIIDAPRGGSLLSELEIIEAVLRAETWTSAFVDRDFKNVSAKEILNFFDA